MNKQIIKEKLKLFGITEEEQDIYLFLIENGAKTALEISRELNINRSKIYRVADALISKNLLETTNEQWGQTYSSASPETLELLLHKEEDSLNKKRLELDGLIEALTSLQGTSNGIFGIRFYKGVEGLKQMIWNDLKGKELLVCGPADLNKMVGQSFADKVREEGVRRGQKVYELNNYHKKFETNVVDFKAKYYQERTISESIISLKNYFEIYNNTIAFAHFEENDLKGVEIHSPTFAHTFKQIFWHYWDLGKDAKVN